MENLSIEKYGTEGYKINGEKFTKIRSMVMGIVIHKNKILLTEHFSKNFPFYRCIGGGIEFFEKAQDALRREFKEEINEEIVIEEYMGMAEELFVHKNRRGHEMIQLYKVTLDTNKLKMEYPIIDDDVVAKWIDVEDIVTGKKVIYPEIVAEYVSKIIYN